MKRHIFGKNIQFALILSVSSFIGMQTVEGAQITCPKARELKPVQQTNGTWKYEGVSPEKSFHFTQTFGTHEPIPLNINLAAVAGKLDDEVSCSYHPKIGYRLVVLETNDAAAKKCKPTGGASFNCSQ
jgi:hypothetical protein